MIKGFFEKTKSVLAIVLVICAIIFGANQTMAEDNTVDEVTDSIDGIILFLENELGADSLQGLVDGYFSEHVDSPYQWVVIGLAQYRLDIDWSIYLDAMDDYLANNKIKNATTMQRFALTYLALGDLDNSYLEGIVDKTVGEQGLMSYVYGLHLLTNGCSSESWTPEKIMDYFVKEQRLDGGWSVSGDVSDVDVTAMVLQSIAPYTRVGITCGTESTTQDMALEMETVALRFLENAQDDSGAFKSMGQLNCESTVQVLITYCEYGYCYKDEGCLSGSGKSVYDGVMSFALPDGSFGHLDNQTYNPLATIQTFYGLVAAWRMNNGYSGFYVLDSVCRDCETCTNAEVTLRKYVEPKITNNSQSINNTENKNSVDMNNSSDSATSGKDSKKLKLVIEIIGAGFFAIILILLKVFKKLNKVNVISVVIGFLLFFAGIHFAKLQTKGDYYGDNTIKEGTVGTVTISITCDTIKDKSDKSYIPKSGVIILPTEMPIYEDYTVYDVLIDVTKANIIQVESDKSYGTEYISGINYIYEKDFGDLSGWMYFVNGEKAAVGCSEYKLKDGDIVEWKYTCDIGHDLEEDSE